jgi:hypothetical protein
MHMAGEPLVKVERAPGQYLKMTPKEAAAYCAANPTAKLKDAKPEAKAVDKAEAEVEDKAVAGPPRYRGK